MLRPGNMFQRAQFWIVPIIWMVPLFGRAQYEPVEIFGTVTDQETQAIIGQGTVVAIERYNSTFTITTELDTAGRYSMILPYDRSFSISFSSPGYVGRYVLVDLNGVAMAQRRPGFGLAVDAVLFKELAGIDYTIFEEEPTGICLYDKGLKTFVWDMSYIESTKKLVQATLDHHRSQAEPPQE